MVQMNKCPCCSNQDYINCCEPYLSGTKRPPTPEALMRSRYTAYTQANVNYIMQTMLPPASDKFDAEEAREWASQAEWLKLDVLNSSQSGEKGLVEFIAYFKDHGQPHTLHEKSEFQLINHKWMYTDGEHK